MLVAVLALGASVQAEDFHYYYYKEKVSLTLDETAIFVVNHDQRPIHAVENYLRAVGMHEFRAQPFIKNGLLFVRDTQSAVSRPIPEIVAEVSERPDNLFFLGPVLKLPHGGRAVVPPTVMVRFNEGVSSSVAEQIIRTMGNSEILTEDFGGMSRAYLIKPRTKSGFVALTTANRLAEQPEVRLGDPGFVSTATPSSSCTPISGVDPPKDEHFSKSWALFNPADSKKGIADGAIDVDAKQAWGICGGSPSIPIAIFDSGCDKSHEDLQVAIGVDCTSGLGGGSICKCDTPGYCDPADYDPNAGSHVHSFEKHGTMVAGVAAAKINNAEFGGPVAPGSAGLAPNLTLISVRTFNAGWDSKDVIAALEWARLHGVRVVNISWNSAIPKEPMETDAYIEARNAGIVLVASAANANEPSPRWPAYLDPIIAVSAIESSGELWVEIPDVSGSNYGPQILIAAPGKEMFSTDRMGLSSGYSSGCSIVGDLCCVIEKDYCCTLDGNYCILSGTSYAAPLVAATAGMILSINPALSPSDVEMILCETAQEPPPSGGANFYGCGILDTEAALDMAVESLTWIFRDGFESGTTAAWSATVGG